MSLLRYVTLTAMGEMKPTAVKCSMLEPTQSFHIIYFLMCAIHQLIAFFKSVYEHVPTGKRKVARLWKRWTRQQP